MNSKKVLALMMGTIIASSVTSQTAVQVYAHDEESSSSSYSYDDSIGISVLDEEESSGGAEPMEDSPAVEELEKLTNFKNERTKDVMSYRHGYFDLLYVSTSNLVFELTSDTEVGLACLDAESEFNGNVVVPEKVRIDGELYSVTSIGDKAFSDCRSLENVTLPASITRIDSCAFNYCSNLQLEALPANLREIGYEAFAFCNRLSLRELPANLREIGNNAFGYCANLQLETLPANLRKIGNYAFAGCRNLQLETLPEGLEEIAIGVFAGTGIRTITIPESVTELGYCAFDTDSIEEIILAERSRLNDGDIRRAYGRQLERIQRVAVFQQGHLHIRQRAITPVELNAENAEKECPICYDKFAEPMEDSPAVEQLIRLINFTSRRVNELLDDESLQVDNLDNLYVSESNLVFEPTSDDAVRLVCLDEESEFNGDIVVPEKVFIYGVTYSVTSIGSSAFDGCRNLENVTLPASITRIGDNAFAYCKNLQLETLPESLEIIDVHAFASCENLRLKKLPSNLRKIGDDAFAFCDRLSLIELPADLREIGNNAFAFCANLQLETLPPHLRKIGDCAFDCCRNLQLEELPEGITEIGIDAFANCRNLRLVALPDGLEIIGARAFHNCRNLRLVALPRGLTRIGDNAFENCVDLQLVALPENLREIGSEAFVNCINLRLEALPRGLTRIGDNAFDNCVNLRLVALPEGLEIIGVRAFANTGIRTITIPASVTELGDSAFETNSIEEINVAQGSGLDDGAIIRAYGRRLGRIQRMALFQQGYLHIRQRMITPVELNAENAEKECLICYDKFNEAEGQIGRLRCGHYIHIDCFENLVREEFEAGRSFKCPYCRK